MLAIDTGGGLVSGVALSPSAAKLGRSPSFVARTTTPKAKDTALRDIKKFVMEEGVKPFQRGSPSPTSSSSPLFGGALIAPEQVGRVSAWGSDDMIRRNAASAQVAASVLLASSSTTIDPALEQQPNELPPRSIPVGAESAPTRTRRLATTSSGSTPRSARSTKIAPRQLRSRGNIVSPSASKRSLPRTRRHGMARPKSMHNFKVSPMTTSSRVNIPVYDSGHLTSPGCQRRVVDESIVSLEASTVLTESFLSPTQHGFKRSKASIFPRAVRDIHKPRNEDTGDVAQAVIGGVGTAPPVSRLRRAPQHRVAQSTREGEALRMKAKDLSLDRHGPADYNTDDRPLRRATSKPVIGRAPRQGPKQDVTPGPAFMPVSTLRNNRAAMIPRARRKGFGEAEATPGPLAYHTERKPKTPSAHFGTMRRRMKLSDSEVTPGPYNAWASTFITGNGRRQPSFGFSTARRF